MHSFNLALLQKWHWRLVNQPNQLWVKLIKSIHGLEAGYDGNGCYMQGLWADIVGSSNYLHSRNLIPKDVLKCTIGSRSTIRFWKDLWIGDEPLKVRYNRLFRLDLNEDCLLSDRLIDGDWSWQWRRPISSGRTESMLHSLLSEVQHTMLASSPDRWTWSIDSDGLFTVSSTRSYIDHHLLPSLNMETRWNKCLPRKVNIFIWRFRLDRLPHRLNLSKRGLDIASILCPICNRHVESNEHVFFSCDVASNVWRLIRIWCNLSDQAMHSFEDYTSWVNALPGSNAKKDRMLVIVASTLWILWKYRNSITFHSCPMRKCDLFDSIRLVSFTWLKFRRRKVHNWSQWLCNPFL